MSVLNQNGDAMMHHVLPSLTRPPRDHPNGIIYQEPPLPVGPPTELTELTQKQ